VYNICPANTEEFPERYSAEVPTQKVSLIISFFTRRKKASFLFLTAGIIIYVKFVHQRLKYDNKTNYFVMQNPY
jgi:hypothetical protein